MTKILLTGKTGQLGWELERSLAPLGELVAVDRSQMDLTNPDAIRNVIRSVAPDIIVNAAGYTSVDKAEVERELAYQINAVAPGIMAEEVKRAGALLVHYSTDYVYDGTKGAQYVESDATNPLNFYGLSKLAGEQAITAAGCRHLILRASWIYSVRGSNFVLTMLQLARMKREVSVVTDQVGCPSWARPLANASAEILVKNGHLKINSGIFHLSAAGQTTRFDFAKTIVAFAKRSSKPDTKWADIHPTTTDNYPLPARRPLHAASSKAKVEHCFGVKIACWQDQLEAFMINRAI